MTVFSPSSPAGFYWYKKLSPPVSDPHSHTLEFLEFDLLASSSGKLNFRGRTTSDYHAGGNCRVHDLFGGA